MAVRPTAESGSGPRSVATVELGRSVWGRDLWQTVACVVCGSLGSAGLYRELSRSVRPLCDSLGAAPAY